WGVPPPNVAELANGNEWSSATPLPDRDYRKGNGMAHLRILAFFLVLCCPIMVYADALLDALMNKDLNRARILIEQSGVDVKAKDKIGRTALMYTAKLGSTVLVKALLARGADVNAKD